jgi:hypothetical protein
VISGGMILMVIGFALLCRLTPEGALSSIVVPMVVLGTGMGLTATIFMLAMQNAVSSEYRGIVTSLTIFSRNIGSAIGVSLQGAVLIAILTRQLELHGASGGTGLAGVLRPGGALGAGVNGLGPAELSVFRQALAQAIRGTFLLDLALVALGLVLVSLFVPSGSVQDLAQPEMSQRVEDG